MRTYTLIHADGSKECELTAESVVKTVNRRYRAGITVSDILLIEPRHSLVCVEDGRDAPIVQAS